MSDPNPDRAIQARITEVTRRFTREVLQILGSATLAELAMLSGAGTGPGRAAGEGPAEESPAQRPPELSPRKLPARPRRPERK